MFYITRTPRWLSILYPGCLWKVNTAEKALYLTFDDGPHPVITPFVLELLAQYNAKATFFCVGKNVAAHPYIFNRIIEEGHAIGNHTQNHLNSSMVTDQVYLDDVEAAMKFIDSRIFRPPYGRIDRFLISQLQGPKFGLKTVMWSVLSGDFDVKLRPEKCLENVVLNSDPGSIIVFHDSEKAYEKLLVALPGTLRYFAEKGYSFKALPY